MTWQSPISRRTLFRGLTLGAGGLLLRPFLRDAEAFAKEPERFAGGGDKAAAGPMRFVFVLEGNGFNADQAMPVGVKRIRDAHNFNKRDDLLDIPLAEQTLPKALEPLAAFQDRLTILMGLSGKVCGGGHSNNFGALGVYSGKLGAVDQTIDAAIAKARPGIFPLVGVGISDRPEHTSIYNVSAWGPGKKLPTICQPELAYNQLFGCVAEGSARDEYLANRELLEFMTDDVRRVEARLTGDEKDKLSAYLGAFSAIRQRQAALEQAADRVKLAAPRVTDKFQSTVETDRFECQIEMAAASLIAGITNVVTVASGCGDPYFSVRFRGLGIDLDKHSIGHGKGLDQRTWEDLVITIRRFHLAQVAKLAERLQAVPEGNGTMLDNTVIVYLSDSAEQHHSRCWEWPMLVLGDLGGRLKTRGRLLYYPSLGKVGHRTIANLYTTLLNLAGTPCQHFGVQDATLKDFDQTGPLSELLA